MPSKTCPECGQIVIGRADKKFCDDYCRNTFNNRNNSDASNYVRNINNVLRKNRRILESKFNNKLTRISFLHLASEGFSFLLHTHTVRNKRGKIWHYCYEYGYMYSSPGHIIINRTKPKDLFVFENYLPQENILINSKNK